MLNERTLTIVLVFLLIIIPIFIGIMIGKTISKAWGSTQTFNLPKDLYTSNYTDNNPFRDEEKIDRLVDDLLNQTETELNESQKICGKINKSFPNMYYSNSPNMWCHST